MPAVSESQRAYRVRLIDQAIDRAARPRADGGPTGMGPAAVEVALLLYLPEPHDSYEASTQIDVLKSSGILAWARTHPEWAQPILDKLVETFGADAAKIPGRQRGGINEGASWYGKPFVAYLKHELGWD